VTHIFTDKILNNDPTTFVRKFLNPNEKTKNKFTKKECYKNGLLIYTESYKKVNFITKSDLDADLNTKFLTIDIETKLINNLIVPRCVSLYDGITEILHQESYDTYFSSVVSEIKPEKQIIQNILEKLFVDKYNNYIVFIHNISKFDIVFILEKIIEIVGPSNVRVLKKDQK
jgi:hypothetical protein